MQHDAIIISDIHLGSECCRAKELEAFLKWAKDNTKMLILNGDVFEDMNFHRLKKHHWHILSILRKMSDHVEVLWIEGNHDGPAEILSNLIGIRVLKEFILESGNQKVMIFHGDKFDKFITDRPILTWIGDMIYGFLQKCDKMFERFGIQLARWAKQSSKHYLHCQQNIKVKATEYAKKHGCDAVACGHTHAPYDDGFYYNSGCWTEPPGTYLSICNGIITVCSYESLSLCMDCT